MAPVINTRCQLPSWVRLLRCLLSCSEGRPVRTRHENAIYLC